MSNKFNLVYFNQIPGPESGLYSALSTPMILGSFLQFELFGGNRIWQIGGLFLVLLVGLIAGKILKGIFRRRSDHLVDKRPVTAAFLGGLASSVVFLTFALGLFSGTSLLSLGDAAELIQTVVGVVLTLAVAWTAHCLIEGPKVWMAGRASKTQSKLDDMLVPIVSKSLSITIGVLAIVQIAQILSGKEVSSILAGLGIGGLAFALAAQDTIKNFFGSILLLSDRPFEIGDRILVDGYDGPVEAVGMRSTRIRTLTGHVVTIPNGELANKSVENVSKRPHIRRLFNITITYDTPPDKVREAKAILEDILKDHEGMDANFPPRVYFNNFESSALNLFCIYWYHPAAYWDFLAFGEKVNLEILDRFNVAGIDFAFPTQTLHLAGDPSRPLEIGVAGGLS
ncbi:MAG: mechanosensitive ion channel family protein [Verrucomicrobiota bacterium]